MSGAAAATASLIGQGLAGDNTETIPQRPHTACAGARPLAIWDGRPSSAAHDTDGDSESDGGEFDDMHEEEEPCRPSIAMPSVLRPRTAEPSVVQSVQVDPTPKGDAIRSTSTRPQTAPARSNNQIQRSEADSAEHGARTQDRLLFGLRPASAAQCRASDTPGSTTPAVSRPSTTMATKKASPVISLLGTPSSASSFKLRSAPPPAAGVAQKLPRHCLVLGTGAPRQEAGRRYGLAPAAAKMRTHSSWAHYLPVAIGGSMIKPEALEQSQQPSQKSDLENRSQVDPATTGTSQASDPSAVASVAAPAASVKSATPPLQAPPCASESGRRGKGPKYKVAPGGSRPGGRSSSASKASTSLRSGERMVLEFRTEPRMVPASRGADRRSLKSGAQADVPRFRPAARSTWVEERQVLAIR